MKTKSYIPSSRACSAWGALWHSKNSLDGLTEYILHADCLPVLFKTRQETRDYIMKEYGFIKTRRDLRDEPFGWRLPKAVRVMIVLKRAESKLKE